MRNEKFEKYKRIKSAISYNYKGYPVEKILAIDLGVMVFNDRKHTFKSYLSYIKNTLPFFIKSLNLDDLKIKQPKKTLFSMGAFQRKDYYELWEDVKSRIKSPLSFDFSRQKNRNSYNFKKAFLGWFIINKTNELKLLAKFRLAAKITHYLHVVDELEKINPVVRKYCAFSSVHNYEVILSFFFRKNKIETYSLQHGIYSVLHDNISLDMILYENFVSDFHLCWGQYTKDEFMSYGINEKSLIVAGYPRNVARPAIPSKLNSSKCLILLTSYIYHDSNLKLLQIFKEFSANNNLDVHVKIHPNSNREFYEKIIAEYRFNIVSPDLTLMELFKNNEFGWAVAINSAAYYEAYMYNIPCLRYNDFSFEDSVAIYDDKFSNLKELKGCIKALPLSEPDQLDEFFSLTNQKLDYAMGINKDRYSKVLGGLNFAYLITTQCLEYAAFV